MTSDPYREPSPLDPLPPPPRTPWSRNKKKKAVGFALIGFVIVTGFVALVLTAGWHVALGLAGGAALVALLVLGIALIIDANIKVP